MGKYFYKLFAGLFALAVVFGFMGVGVASRSRPSEDPYAAFLKKRDSARHKDYSSRLSREGQRELNLIREQQANNRQLAESRLRNQSLPVASQSYHQVNVEENNERMRERLMETRYKNIDTQNRYRELMQRLK